MKIFTFLKNAVITVGRVIANSVVGKAISTGAKSVAKYVYTIVMEKGQGVIKEAKENPGKLGTKIIKSVATLVIGVLAGRGLFRRTENEETVHEKIHGMRHEKKDHDAKSAAKKAKKADKKKKAEAKTDAAIDVYEAIKNNIDPLREEEQKIKNSDIFRAVEHDRAISESYSEGEAAGQRYVAVARFYGKDANFKQKGKSRKKKLQHVKRH